MALNDRLAVIQRLAHRFAQRDKYEWQAYPGLTQMRKQDRYTFDAEQLLLDIDRWREEAKTSTRGDVR